MIDYLWGWREVDAERMAQALLEARPGVDPASVVVREVGGGTLVTAGQAYHGFESAETDNELLVILGGPIPASGGAEISQNGLEIWGHWLLENMRQSMGELAFDLIGGFQLVRISKESGSICVLIDAGGFVPCYATTAFRDVNEAGLAICGSNADAVAQAADVDGLIDAVSVADFLMHQTVTYPHTMYQHVHQLPPASHIERAMNGTIKVNSYWRPEESPEYKSLKEAGQALRHIFERNVSGIADGETGATVLMSGGEDSRVVLAALPESLNKEAVTVTDFFNHEARVARKVSGQLGANWRLVERSPTHYLDQASRAIRLSESHNFFYHAHFCGLEEKIGQSQLVLGGVMADAYCKGCHIKSRKDFGIAHPTGSQDWRYLGTSELFDIQGRLRRDVDSRRNRYNDELESIRTGSWPEWHSLYPATMGTAASNYFINRRLFVNYEPFMDSSVIRWSAHVPQDWKLNRKVFHQAVKPILGRVKTARHAKGTFPYFGWRINGPLSWLLGQFERVKRKYRAVFKIAKTNEGPWPVWKDVVSHEAFHRLAKFDSPLEEEKMRALLGDEVLSLVKRSMEDWDSVQCLAGLQIRIWAGMLVQRQSLAQHKGGAED